MIIPEEIAKKIDDVYKMLALANEEDRHVWVKYEFLSWQWIFCLLLALIPWVIWWKFRKKESSNRLLCGGLFIIGISMMLDSFGTELGLWDYRYELVPFLPSFIPWDLCFFPVIFMFIVQIKPKISPILKAIVYSIVGAFIGEPIFQWLGYYEPLKWSTFYSLPIYFLKFLIGYSLVMSDNFKMLESK